MANTTKKTPFSIYSSSVNTGYGSEISSSFMPGVDITNLHSDEYGSSRDAPAQGPFTEKYVGGNQHRHVALNDGNDTSMTRPELFNLQLSSGQIRVVGQSSGSGEKTVEDLQVGIVNSPQGLAVDATNEKIYWRQSAQDSGEGVDLVKRANLDGTQAITLISLADAHVGDGDFGDGDISIDLVN